MSDTDKIKIITNNRKANFEYAILDKYEAGISLEGTEVKSLREAKVSIGESYARVIKDEVFLIGANINEYKYGNINNHIPDRNRKLLLHKKEIKKIKEALTEKGLTLIPLKMYFKNSKVKVELGIGRGKKLYDKRESIKQRETDLKLKRIKL
ncbi:MAG: SsrA-binding protein SmpB [Ignavibacteria bacterium]|jgi:SsrA-binding protein|nr:SsrA-binding protein SmpB [Ignavibacteria bacterium]